MLLNRALGAPVYLIASYFERLVTPVPLHLFRALIVVVVCASPREAYTPSPVSRLFFLSCVCRLVRPIPLNLFRAFLFLVSWVSPCDTCLSLHPFRAFFCCCVCVCVLAGQFQMTGYTILLFNCLGPCVLAGISVMTLLIPVSFLGAIVHALTTM